VNDTQRRTTSAMATFHAYAAQEPCSRLAKITYQCPPLGEHDVEIDITHNGLCHTDIHMLDNDWKITKYPFVPGHEIVGKIVAKGNEVKHLTVGQRVGTGWLRNSCRNCMPCMEGEENLCHKGYTGTILGHHGGFQKRFRTNGDFVFPIPDNLDSATAAPLFCAGITLYAPLRRHLTHPNMRVGIIGVGGLGHVGLQFARAMGAEVTAFSTSSDKKQDAINFGAHHFALLSDLTHWHNTQDVILNTASGAVDSATLMPLLRPNGKLVLLGVPYTTISIPDFPLITEQKSIVGSMVGGRRDTQEMLNFAAVHNIRPKIETVPLSQVNEAIQKVKSNKARYRIVLVTDE